MPQKRHILRNNPKLFNPDNYAQMNDLMHSNVDSTRLRAFLNYVLFDKNMQVVGSFTGAWQAAGEGTWQPMGTGNNPMTIPVNGYLAVYISNASMQADEGNSDVWFDHISIKISKGHLREEKHYYPYGLPMAGIGASDLRQNPNRRRYQGNEYIKALGLNWMSFGARQYDPQLGRFMSVDPLAAAGGQEMMSPYAAMGDEPVSTTDADGRQPQPKKFQFPVSLTPWWHMGLSTSNYGYTGGYTQEALNTMPPGFTPNTDPMGIGAWMDEVAVAAKIEEIFNESVGNALTISGDAAQALFSLLQKSSSFQITEKGLAMSFENGDAATFGFNGIMSHSFGVKYAYACKGCKDLQVDKDGVNLLKTQSNLLNHSGQVGFALGITGDIVEKRGSRLLGKGIGLGGYAVGGFGLYREYNLYKKGKVSTFRIGYDATGYGASLAAEFILGTEAAVGTGGIFIYLGGVYDAGHIIWHSFKTSYIEWYSNSIQVIKKGGNPFMEMARYFSP